MVEEDGLTLVRSRLPTWWMSYIGCGWGWWGGCAFLYSSYVIIYRYCIQIYQLLKIRWLYCGWTIRKSSSSWCCRNLLLWFISRWLMPSVTSRLTHSYSLSRLAPLLPVECYWCLLTLFCLRRTDQIYGWCHSILYSMYPWFLITKFGCNSIQELIKVNLSAFTLEVSNHVVDGWVLWFKTKTLHGRFKLSTIELLNYLGSILPVASVSNKLKASLSS